MAPHCPPIGRVGALAFLAGVLAASSAVATQVVRLDTPALVRGSSDIVVGEVTGTVSRWNASHTRILTDVTVRVEESLKGSGASTLTLTQLGGDLDGLHLEIEGSPAFRSGERSVFFVWRDRQGRAQVNGLAQGKFDIVRDAASGRALVRRQLGGMTLLDPRTARTQRAAAAVEGAMPLDDFKAEIRRAMATSTPENGK